MMSYVKIADRWEGKEPARVPTDDKFQSTTGGGGG